MIRLFIFCLQCLIEGLGRYATNLCHETLSVGFDGRIGREHGERPDRSSRSCDRGGYRVSLVLGEHRCKCCRQ